MKVESNLVSGVVGVFVLSIALAGMGGVSATQPVPQRVSLQRPEVERLEAALHHYRGIVTRGGWASIPDGPVLREDDVHPRVRMIRDRLAVETGVPARAAEHFDAALVREVRAFQGSHGLEVDGVVGRRTLAALNISAPQRVRQIELNLNRLRAETHPKPQPRIEVNIAEQVLRYHDAAGDVLSMRVIVGRPDWPTPIFQAEVEAVIFAPYWNVPSRIAALEVIPAIRRDPSYLARNDMEIVTRGGTARVIDASTIDWSRVTAATFPHRIRQRPGARNPLGDVKFLLPNRYDIFLHDTPGRAAFARADRALSHGCIRLERALDLARSLLTGNTLAHPDSVQAIVAAGRERAVRIDRTVPVILSYRTAWVDADGTVQFRDDIYGHDRRTEPPANAPDLAESECAVPVH